MSCRSLPLPIFGKSPHFLHFWKHTGDEQKKSRGKQIQGKASQVKRSKPDPHIHTRVSYDSEDSDDGSLVYSSEDDSEEELHFAADGRALILQNAHILHEYEDEEDPSKTKWWKGQVIDVVGTDGCYSAEYEIDYDGEDEFYTLTFEDLLTDYNKGSLKILTE